MSKNVDFSKSLEPVRSLHGATVHVAGVGDRLYHGRHFGWFVSGDGDGYDGLVQWDDQGNASLHGNRAPHLDVRNKTERIVRIVPYFAAGYTDLLPPIRVRVTTDDGVVVRQEIV